MGWFGFNAGSALSSGSLATSAFVATHFGAAAAAIGWMLAEWVRNGKPSALGAISGAWRDWWRSRRRPGLWDRCRHWSSALSPALFCYFMVAKVKARFGYDDSLDAFGVHGAGGTIGALLTGVFASRLINPIFKDAQGNALPVGMIDGNDHQMLNQLVGVGMAMALADRGHGGDFEGGGCGDWIARSSEHEIEGLDLTQHGEEGYYWEPSTT